MSAIDWFYVFAALPAAVAAGGLFWVIGKLGPEVRREADSRRTDHLVTRR